MVGYVLQKKLSMNELKKVYAAFRPSTGHTHDGTTDGDGAEVSHQTAINTGTPGANVTAVTYGTGINNTVVLTLTNIALTVGHSADLGVGSLIWTAPAGNITIKNAYIQVNLSGVSTTNDTPEVGLGTVIASGAVTALNGTATFENILTGTAAPDTNGTDEISQVGTVLNILTGAAHTVHLNYADGWAANADKIAAVNGTVVLEYRYNAA